MNSISHLEDSFYLMAKDSRSEIIGNKEKKCFLSDGILTIRSKDMNEDVKINVNEIDDVFDTSDGSTFSFGIRFDNNVYIFTAKKHVIVRKWMTALKAPRSANEIDVHTTIKAFKMISTIGRGGCGEVMLARYIPNGKLVAIKSIPKEGIGSSNSVKHAFAERNILMMAQNPFITRLLSTFQNKESFFLALEYMPGGDLAHHLAKNKFFSPFQTQIYLAEIAMALSHLHKMDIIFRDLKPSNILIDAKGHLKLTDFGLAKYLLIEDHTSSICGTYEYLAPEMIRGSNYNFAVDWWSYGVVAYQLLEGVLPFESQNLSKLYERISKSPVRFWKAIPNEAKSFIQSLLQRNPSKRLGCGELGESEIFEHPYFANIDWDKIKNKEYTMEFIPEIYKELIDDEYYTDEEKIRLNDIDYMFEKFSLNCESHVPGFSYAGQGLQSPILEGSFVVK